MSDTNVSHKLAEAITKIIKKTNVYEKSDNMFKGLAFFMLFTGTMTLINYFTTKDIYLQNIEQLFIIKKINNKLELLHNKIDKLLEDNDTISREENITTKLNLSQDKCDESYNITKNIEIKNDNIYEDNELLNECYNIIPCNNSTKFTGINSLFYWK
jgi:hypothetical protein